MKIIMKDGWEAIGVGERKRKKKTQNTWACCFVERHPVSRHLAPLSSQLAVCEGTPSGNELDSNLKKLIHEVIFFFYSNNS